MNIYLKLAWCTGENLFGCFQVDNKDTLHSLKAKIQDEGRIPCGMQLLLNSEGDQLTDDSKTLEEYGISNGETIFFVTTRPVQVYVFLIHNERTISLEVEFFDTVDSLKAKIHDMEGIPPANQWLKQTYSNKELEGGRTIFNSEIRTGDTLFLQIPPMRIHVMFVPTSENICVKVKETDTIDYVKAKIQSKIRVPIDKQRVHSCILQMEESGDTFDGHRTLADYEIKNGDRLYCGFVVKDKWIKTMDISPVSSELVKILAMMLNGKTVNLEVNTSVSMSRIKSLLEAKEGLPPNQHMLFLKGKPLNDDLILKNFELPVKSTLYLLPNPRARVQVLVKLMSGKTRVMKVRSTKTVSELIAKIHRKEGLPAEKEHKLLFNKKQLDKDSKILECNLIWNSVLCFVPSRELMLMTIKTLSGNNMISIEVESSCTIGGLKAKILDEEGIQFENVSLEFSGIQLQDNSTLSYYNINKNSTLQLVRRL